MKTKSYVVIQDAPEMDYYEGFCGFAQKLRNPGLF